MPMDMTIYCMMPNGGTMLCHIGVGFLLFVLLSRHCEGLELQISNSRSALFLCAYVCYEVGRKGVARNGL